MKNDGLFGDGASVLAWGWQAARPWHKMRQVCLVGIVPGCIAAQEPFFLQALSVADLNGDGLPDVAVAGAGGLIVDYRNP